MLYFDARLSEGQPTLEVRILDAVTDPEDVGLLAALVRALVETAVDDWPEGLPVWRAEELRAARWRASRYGLADELLDPVTHALRPAREVLSRLVELVSARLDADGDGERVAARCGAGAEARRERPASGRPTSAPARCEGVVDDVLARTAASWASPNEHAIGPRVRSWAKRSRHRSSPGPTGPATARRSGAASTCSRGCCARRGSTPTTR